MATRPIFRERALDAYRRRAARDVVPRLVTGPIIACCWVLVAVLMVAAGVAWSVRVPTYVAAPGVIVGTAARLDPQSGTTSAVLFVPPDRASQLHAGERVRGEIASSGRFLQGAIVMVLPLVGPDAARARYRLSGTGVIEEPARAVTVRLGSAVPASSYAGTRFSARVDVGSKRLLAFLPGIGNLFGGGS